jgi:hypothetical protein
MKTLLVNDNDVTCKTESDLSGMSMNSLNFIPRDLEEYDLIVYQGKRGTKVLKSTVFKTGEIK